MGIGSQKGITPVVSWIHVKVEIPGSGIPIFNTPHIPPFIFLWHTRQSSTKVGYIGFTLRYNPVRTATGFNAVAVLDPCIMPIIWD